MKARDFRAKAWTACKANWGVAILSFFIFVIITGLCAAIPGVGALSSLVITGPLTLGEAIIFIKLIKGEKAEIANLFDGFKNFVNSFLLYILNGIFTFLWSLLSILTLGILMLWVAPVMEASHAAFYESLKPAQAVVEEVAE